MERRIGRRAILGRVAAATAELIAGSHRVGQGADNHVIPCRNNIVAGVGDSLMVASANTGGADYDSPFSHLAMTSGLSRS